MRTILAAAILCVASTANGAFLDFGGIEILPTILADGTKISRIGVEPAGVTMIGPRTDVLIAPFLSDSWAELVMWADVSGHYSTEGIGYRFEFPEITTADIALHVRMDDHLIRLATDGVFAVNKNHADFLGDGTNVLTTLHGLRDEDTLSITIPLFDIVTVSNATVVDWTWTSGTVFHEDVPLNTGIALDVTAVNEPAGWLLGVAACGIYLALRRTSA